MTKTPAVFPVLTLAKALFSPFAHTTATTLRTSCRRPLLRQNSFKALRAKRLPAAVRAWITDDFLDAVVDRHGTGVGLNGESPSHIAVGHAVAVSVELNAEILVDQRFRRIAIVIGNDRQRS